MREKTGYCDRKGKAIRDGDKLWGMFNGDIVRGRVEEIGGSWELVNNDFALALRYFDDIDLEILEGEEC